jgi:mannose-1-phosphate guanylyltransferase
LAERFAIVMAGGSGTRFWPASRGARPKQFLALSGSDETLLQATVRRASALVGSERVLVVTSQRHAALAREQLPSLAPSQLLLEPAGRNTAPCIAWGTAHVRRRDPEGVIVALPADAHVADEAAFGRTLERAFQAAAGGSITTLGIAPTRPETGYGYLEVGDAVADGVHRVRAFVEKPTRDRARAFLEAGTFLWNSGIFLFRTDVILREIERHLPDLAAFVARCDEAARAGDGQETALVASEYAGLPSISIDHGVMEKAGGILVVPARFGWDDLGSWAAAWSLAHRDEHDNASNTELLAIDAQGCLARSTSGKLIVLLGMQDMVIVDTDDALLVMPRERAQDVSKVVSALKASGKEV